MARRPLPGSPPRPTGRLLGYARVSTEDQATDAQTDELQAAGCAAIYQEHGSGASRARPELARLMREIRHGDVLVVVRLDRLARSVSHLLEVIERLEESGAHFRSLRDPIDTSTPQGMFSLQVLGAVAQLERALISERTKAGIKAAHARGKLSGNPGLRAQDPAAIAKAAQARNRIFTGDVIGDTARFARQTTLSQIKREHRSGDLRYWTVFDPEQPEIAADLGRLFPEIVAGEADVRPAERCDVREQVVRRTDAA